MQQSAKICEVSVKEFDVSVIECVLLFYSKIMIFGLEDVFILPCCVSMLVFWWLH